ncbi:MAG: ArsR/SmtB family transcription factor [Alphaproteobacteria bacterium]
MSVGQTERKSELELQTEAARKLSVLGKPLRLHLYRFLVKAGHTGASVGDIRSHLANHDYKFSASTLSHHIAQLVWAGLIRQDRQGTTLICHAEFDEMDALIAFLRSECCSLQNTTISQKNESTSCQN